MPNVYAANAMCAKLQTENAALRAALETALTAMTTTRIIEGISPFMATAIETARAALAAGRGEG